MAATVVGVPAPSTGIQLSPGGADDDVFNSGHAVEFEAGGGELHLVHADAEGKLLVLGILVIEGAASDALSTFIAAARHVLGSRSSRLEPFTGYSILNSDSAEEVRELVKTNPTITSVVVCELARRSPAPAREELIREGMRGPLKLSRSRSPVLGSGRVAMLAKR